MLIGNFSLINKNAGRNNGYTSTSHYFHPGNKKRINFNLIGFTAQSASGATKSTCAVPTGYYPQGAWAFPITNGEMSAIVEGDGDITDADIWAVKLAIAAISGSGTISNALGSLIVQAVAAISGSGTISAADLKAFLNAIAAISGSGGVSSAALTGLGALIAALTGTGTVNPTLTGIGELDADLKAYGDLTNEGVRDAVWDAITSQFNESGTMGEVMNNIGAGSNPWSALLDDNNDPGTFGERVQKLLTVAKFLGLK